MVMAEFNSQDLSKTVPPGHASGEERNGRDGNPVRVGGWVCRRQWRQVWAFAKLGCIHTDLFDAVAAEAASRIAEFNSHDCSSLLWAFTKARVPANDM